MMPFDLVEPSSLSEAIGLLDPDDPAVRPIAGGTALMLMMKSGFFRPKRLVSLNALGEDLASVTIAPSGELRIGAMVRLAGLERATEIRRVAPVIAETLRRHSNPRVRNVATVGGNLAHADPHMDLPPVLVALGAEVEIAGPRGAPPAAGRRADGRLLRDGARRRRAHRGALCPAAAAPARALRQMHHARGR
jgi:carbon-monoxide dehydrogenase medium subunit